MLFTAIIDFIYANRKNGRRGCFMWTDEGLDAYIKWAFSRNGILITLSDNKISGLAIVYALPNGYSGKISSLLPSDSKYEFDENKSDLCVMDWIALNPDARKGLITQFQQRFPNWEAQNKYGIHFRKVKLLSNKYMNILKGLN